jgi:hypothetical protein
LTELVIFEYEEDNLRPLTLTRPAHSLVYSFRPIRSHIKRHFGAPSAYILPDRFGAYKKEIEPDCEVNPQVLEGDVTLINGAIRPSHDTMEAVKGLHPGQALADGDVVVAARLGSLTDAVSPTASGLRKMGVEILDGEGFLIKGPWELIASLESKLEGSGVVYGSSVSVEEPAVFDTKRGPVLLSDGVRVEAFSRVEGPSIIGRGTVLHSARINGNSFIGDSCRVGGEVESSVISSYTNKTHFGYVGHSYLGEWVNMGAGSVTSDLKNTYGTIRVGYRGGSFDTGMAKLGCFIGDYAKVSINCSIFAGKSIGSASHVYGLIERDVPPFTSYGPSIGLGTRELRLTSVIETASRMKARRNKTLGPGEEFLLRKCFEASADLRRQH